MTKRIPLSGKHGNGKYALVDDEHYDEIAPWRWHLNRDGYAGCKAVYYDGAQVTLMHRFIIRATADQRVDHRNGDKLDNRKANLRIATAGGNQTNRIKTLSFKGKPASSIYKGVSRSRSTGAKPWAARICTAGKTHTIGMFDSEKEAAEAYDAAAVRLHGEFARLNFPS